MQSLCKERKCMEKLKHFIFHVLYSQFGQGVRVKLGLMKTASHLLINFSMGYTFGCWPYSLSPSSGSCPVENNRVSLLTSLWYHSLVRPVYSFSHRKQPSGDIFEWFWEWWYGSSKEAWLVRVYTSSHQFPFKLMIILDFKKLWACFYLHMKYVA